MERIERDTLGEISVDATKYWERKQNEVKGTLLLVIILCR